MKRLLAYFAFFCLSVSSVHAYGRFAPVQANISFSPYQVTATVVNRFYRPIICSGYAYGRTFYGNVFNSYMNNVVVYPGNHAQVFVYNYNSNGFVNGWSDIRCRWH